MSSITQIAEDFFEACEAGKGWQACATYCHPSAEFAAQSDALTGIETVEAYTEWVKGLYEFVTEPSYEVQAFGTDLERGVVVIHSIFSGTHTGEGGPVPPTGKSTRTDYVYSLRFDGDRISHMTKIWNSGHAMQELGWA